jgi:hypothetical protein
MIEMEIGYDDCALVLRPNGGIDVYCPEIDKAAGLPNVRMLRLLLISLVKATSDSADVQELLEEIDQHILPELENKVLH